MTDLYATVAQVVAEIAERAIVHDETQARSGSDASNDGDDVLVLTELLHGVDLQQQVPTFVWGGVVCQTL